MIILAQLFNAVLHTTGTIFLIATMKRDKKRRGLWLPLLIFALARLVFFVVFFGRLIIVGYYAPSLEVTATASFSSAVEAIVFSAYGYFFWSQLNDKL